MKVAVGARTVVLFFYGFIVGDDPTVAVVMLVTLAATAWLVAGGVNSWWLVPPVAVAMTGVSLWRRNRRSTGSS